MKGKRQAGVGRELQLELDLETRYELGDGKASESLIWRPNWWRRDRAHTNKSLYKLIRYTWQKGTEEEGKKQKWEGVKKEGIREITI